MTKTERRLLTAIAVAQAEPALLDNYLYKFVVDKQLRGTLRLAVRALADDLAALGYQFQAPCRNRVNYVPADAR